MKLNTVLGRITLLFFALIIPWSVVSFTLMERSVQGIEHATEEKLLQSRYNSIVSFEDQMMDTISAANLSKALERSVSLSTLDPFLSDYEHAQYVKQIQESLALIKVMGKFFSNARVYLLPLGRIYNADNYVLGSVQDLDAETAAHIVSLTRATVSILNDDGRAVMLISNSISNPISVLEVELSMQQMRYHLGNELEFKHDSLFAMQFGSEDTIVQNISDSSLYAAAAKAAAGQKSQTLREFEYDDQDYLLFAYRSNALNYSYFELIPASLVFKPVQLSTTLTIIFALMTVVIVLLFFASAVRLIHKPMKNLTAGFDQLGAGDFSVRVQTQGTDDFAYLYHSFNHMAGEMDTLVTQNYQKTLLLQKAELRQLQSQINPHFLYNSFFLLQRIIESEDTEQASLISQELGQYFRYITKQNTDTVRLIDEDSHARIYANMQARRFAGRISVQFSEPPTICKNVMVPKLFLQPIIENAFKYGLEDKMSDGLLRVRYALQDNELLYIHLEDNGEKCIDAQLAALQQRLDTALVQPDVDNLSGLMNIAKRLNLYYHADDCIQIRRSELGGICIITKLYITEGGNHGNANA